MDWDSCTEKITYTVKSETRTGKVPTIDCVFVLFERLIFFAFMFVGIVAVILVMVGAVRFILSGGDAKQVGEAKKMITFALIGLAFILLSMLILGAISGITGVDCILTFGFTHCI